MSNDNTDASLFIFREDMIAKSTFKYRGQPTLCELDRASLHSLYMCMEAARRHFDSFDKFVEWYHKEVLGGRAWGR